MRLHGAGIVATIAGLAVLGGCASPAGRLAAGGARSRARPHPQVAGLRRPAARPASLPRIKARPPWPVVLHTNAGRYLVERDGVIRRLGRARARVSGPPGFVWVNWPAHAWAIVRAGHLEIVRRQEVVWRSARAYRVGSAGNMNTILTSPAGIAFQVSGAGPWYEARWNGPEHLQARSGWPEAWTRSGNLIAVQGDRRDGYAYGAYSPSGARVATLATGLNSSLLDQGELDPVSGTFWFVGADQVLYRTDGSAVSRVADLSGFGTAHGNTAVVNLLSGGVIQAVSAGWRHGQVIFSPGGQVVARIPAPRSLLAAGFGLVAVNLRRRAVAYALDEAGDRATVFLVRPGMAPAPAYFTEHGASPCAPALSWHGSWLLYSAPTPVLIDATGGHRAIRLPAAIAVGRGRIARVFAARWR